MNIISTFFKNLLEALKYLGWMTINPAKAMKNLVNEKKQVTYAWYAYGLSAFLFALILIPAALFLRPTGWLPLFIKGIPSEMIYVYFLFTAPISFILNLLVFAAIEMTGLFVKKSEVYPFDSTFSTSMMAITLVVLLDFITEAVPIIYFFITNDSTSLFSISDFIKSAITTQKTTAPHFNTFLLMFMFFMYGIMFCWMIGLLSTAVSVVKKVKVWQAVITGIVSTLLYWLVMTIWIF